jgi:hypothetical protein
VDEGQEQVHGGCARGAGQPADALRKGLWERRF